MNSTRGANSHPSLYPGIQFANDLTAWQCNQDIVIEDVNLAEGLKKLWRNGFRPQIANQMAADYMSKHPTKIEIADIDFEFAHLSESLAYATINQLKDSMFQTRKWEAPNVETTTAWWDTGDVLFNPTTYSMDESVSRNYYELNRGNEAYACAQLREPVNCYVDDSFTRGSKVDTNELLNYEPYQAESESYQLCGYADDKESLLVRSNLLHDTGTISVMCQELEQVIMSALQTLYIFSNLTSVNQTLTYIGSNDQDQMNGLLGKATLTSTSVNGKPEASLSAFSLMNKRKLTRHVQGPVSATPNEEFNYYRLDGANEYQYMQMPKCSMNFNKVVIVPYGYRTSTNSLLGGYMHGDVTQEHDEPTGPYTFDDAKAFATNYEAAMDVDSDSQMLKVPIGGAWHSDADRSVNHTTTHRYHRYMMEANSSMVLDSISTTMPIRLRLGIRNDEIPIVADTADRELNGFPSRGVTDAGLSASSFGQLSTGLQYERLGVYNPGARAFNNALLHVPYPAVDISSYMGFQHFPRLIQHPMRESLWSIGHTNVRSDVRGFLWLDELCNSIIDSDSMKAFFDQNLFQGVIGSRNMEQNKGVMKFAMSKAFETVRLPIRFRVTYTPLHLPFRNIGPHTFPIDTVAIANFR